MKPEARLKLITRNTEEVITEEEMNAVCGKKKPVAYIGYAPTGMLHVGHIVPILKAADFLRAGFRVKYLMADLHAYLDAQKSPWELLHARAEWYEEAIKGIFDALGVDQSNLEFVLGSSFQLKEDYMMDVLRMAGEVTLARCRRAAAEVVRFGDEPKLGGFVYPLMQNEDFVKLECDVCFSGVDQRGIYMLGRETLPQMGHAKPVCVFTPLLPSLEGGKAGGKMSASEERGKIGLTDPQDIVEKKVMSAFCPAGEVDGNAVLAFTKHVVMTVLADREQALVIERPAKFGGNAEYRDYAALEKDFAEKKLHPMDLKKAVARELNQLLEPVRKRFEGKAGLQARAYPAAKS
ncbi:MAG: tyrosine--tRNA ligase [Candidatus Diapherotrites archaeon]|nr:tyrosine--tRNA ligase [Candidatus Diapherotrites archaeon]